MKHIKLRLTARNVLMVMFEGICITLALALVFPSMSAHAAEFRWEQPRGTTSVISIPMRGALTLLDQKRASNETQWVLFQVDLGAYFATFPNEHLFVIVDGEYNIRPGRAVPYGGRGIALWKDKICIEEFSNATISPDSCTQFTLPWSSWPPIKYEIIVHASETYVAYWIRDLAGNTLVHKAGYRPDLLRGISDISLIGIGALGDGVPYSAPIQISDLKQGRF